MKKNKFLLVALSAILISANYSLYGQIITRVAGTGAGGFSGDGGQATAAQLFDPADVAFDGSGNMYIADNYNRRVRMVNTSGVISTIAGNGDTLYHDNVAATASGFRQPRGLLFDGSGNLYIADHQDRRVRKVATNGIITTFAGNGSSSSSGDGGQATAASIGDPNGLAIDGSGNVYIATYVGKNVRKVNISGIISTFAGSSSSGYAGDGGSANATSTKLTSPLGVTFDANGNLFITDYGVGCVREVSGGIISTYVSNPGIAAKGYYGDGGPATAAQIGAYKSVFDKSGNLYIADWDNNRIRKVNASGIISTFAGTGTATESGDGGNAATATLHNPSGVAFDASGNLYISDYGNSAIRKISNDTPRFSIGYNQSATICMGTTLTLSSELAITDDWVDTKVTWTIVSGATNGSLTSSYAPTGTYSGSAITPSSSLVYTPSSSGTDVFTVQISDGYLTSKTSFHVNITALPAITGTKEVCVASTTTLSGSPGSGTWSTGSSNVTAGSSTGVVTGLASGTAAVTYTTGCGYTTAVVTVDAPPSHVCASATPNVVCSDGTFDLAADVGDGGTNLTYSWSGPSGVLGTSASLSSVAANTVTTVYSLSVTSGVCSADIATARVIVTPPCAGERQNRNASNPNQNLNSSYTNYTLFPNPTAGTVGVFQHIAVDESVSVKVMNSVGSLFYSGVLAFKGGKCDLSLTTAPPGTYFVDLVNAKGEKETFGVVLQK